MLLLMPLMNKLNESTSQAKTYTDMLNIEAITKQFKTIINTPEVKNTFTNETNNLNTNIESIIGLVNKFKTQPSISEMDFDGLSKKFQEFKTKVIDFAEKLMEIAPTIKSLDNNVGNPIFSNLLDRHPSNR